jgi:hypothetical protein
MNHNSISLVRTDIYVQCCSNESLNSIVQERKKLLFQILAYSLKSQIMAERTLVKIIQQTMNKNSKKVIKF